MHLLLIRHGQTSLHKRKVLAGWTNDPGLDFVGQEQVKKLAEHISEFFPQIHFDAIYTSTLPRANQTAEILSAMLTVPLFVDDDLKDINIGDWAGQPLANVVNSIIGKRYFLDPVGVRLPDGEEITEVLDRVIPVVEHIRKDFINGSAIVVSHLDVIKLILTYYTHQSLHDLHKMEMISTASGCMLSFSQDEVQVMPIPASSNQVQPDLNHS
jgi:broad specificity phosphatase PhoE